ncbi:cytochrome c oxidase subunit II [Bhargavaea ullalensis]|uniref:Cytochrome c oxidase subunit 2 n=1 Tax=Bhargavaea ullalensis TaxID=1265685 RepID=A0ABV2GCB1_9BACL
MMKGLKKWRFPAMLAALALVLSGCGEEYLSALRPSGEVGQEQFNLLILTSLIMLLVILVVVVIYVAALVKFRRSRLGEDHMPDDVEGSHKLEFIWTAIPILLLLIIAIPTVYYTYKLGDVSAMEKTDDDGNPEHLVVDVTAKLYWWEFEYPEYGIVTAQELVVPTGEKVFFNLKAADVKHSFWIPAIGGKMDTNVDNLNKFYLVFDKESKDLKDGVFYGKCAELCGPSHALMDFKVKTMNRDDFDGWVAAMKETEGQMPDKDSADAGEAAFAQSCIGCHATSGVGASGAAGPNMATFGDRNRVAGYLDHDKENIVNWIQDPQKYKPGNLMPAFDSLSDEDLDAIADYLLGLKVEE